MRTVSLHPLTRVEGHGRVDLVLQKGRLVQARVSLLESPRLFEGLVVGRSFAEVPALVCRVCAICSAVHRVAAAGALEKALGLKIPAAARKVRELLLLGGHIESHALHLFCLVLPDLFQAASIIDLLRAGNEIAREGLALKKLGNRLQELAGGRVIHPVNVEVGGVLRLPDRRELHSLLTEIDTWEKRLPELVAPFDRAENYPPAKPALGTRISVSGGGGFSLFGETLSLSDGRVVAGEKYRGLLAERPVSHSNAKESGEESAPFLAGALARLENAGRSGCGLAFPPASFGIHGNNAAQGRELFWVLQRMRRLGEDLLECEGGEPLLAEVRPGAGIGTEVIEAPRGLLIHHYALDDRGRVVAADIVTPTAINQATMEGQLLADLADAGSEADMVIRAQRLIRAYDPCISCSVHVLRVKEGR